MEMNQSLRVLNNLELLNPQLGLPQGQSFLLVQIPRFMMVKTKLVDSNLENHHLQPWNGGFVGAPFEHPHGGHGMLDGFANASDSHGKAAFHQGDYGRNSGGLLLNPPPLANKGMEQAQSGNAMDPRDGKGILAPQPMTLPPPPPPPPHSSQLKRKFYPESSRDGQGYGWQHENRDSFGSSQD